MGREHRLARKDSDGGLARLVRRKATRKGLLHASPIKPWSVSVPVRGQHLFRKFGCLGIPDFRYQCRDVGCRTLKVSQSQPAEPLSLRLLDAAAAADAQDLRLFQRRESRDPFAAVRLRGDRQAEGARSDSLSRTRFDRIAARNDPRIFPADRHLLRILLVDVDPRRIIRGLVGNRRTSICSIAGWSVSAIRARRSGGIPLSRPSADDRRPGVHERL